MVALSELLRVAEEALADRDVATLRSARDTLLTWHAAHHGGRNASLDTWQEARRGAIQGVYCTGCQVWPVIVRLHEALITEVGNG